jgi:hypothetical protein
MNKKNIHRNEDEHKREHLEYEHEQHEHELQEHVLHVHVLYKEKIVTVLVFVIISSSVPIVQIILLAICKLLEY